MKKTSIIAVGVVLIGAAVLGLVWRLNRGISRELCRYRLGMTAKAVKAVGLPVLSDVPVTADPSYRYINVQPDNPLVNTVFLVLRNGKVVEISVGYDPEKATAEWEAISGHLEDAFGKLRDCLASDSGATEESFIERMKTGLRDAKFDGAKGCNEDRRTYVEVLYFSKRFEPPHGGLSIILGDAKYRRDMIEKGAAPARKKIADAF